MILEAVLIGTVTLTAYRPIPEQTDSSPTWTSIGDRTTMFGAAVSQDLLRSHEVCYGDVLIIDGYGPRIVNDTMNLRVRRAVDFLVMTHEQEQRIGTKRKRAWVLKSSYRSCLGDM